MATRQTGRLDDAQGADLGVHTTADARRRSPRRDGQLVGLGVGEIDAAVVGEDDGHVDALAAQLRRQPRGGLGEPAHGGDGSKLGGCKQDAHVAHHGRQNTAASNS